MEPLRRILDRPSNDVLGGLGVDGTSFFRDGPTSVSVNGCNQMKILFEMMERGDMNGECASPFNFTQVFNSKTVHYILLLIMIKVEVRTYY